MSPGGVQGRLSDLADPIRLLGPGPDKHVTDVIGVTMFLVDVENRDHRLARQEDPVAQLNNFDAAAATDRASPARASCLSALPRRRWAFGS